MKLNAKVRWKKPRHSNLNLVLRYSQCCDTFCSSKCKYTTCVVSHVCVCVCGVAFNDPNGRNVLKNDSKGIFFSNQEGDTLDFVQSRMCRSMR